MPPDSPKDRRAALLLLVALAMYALVYFLCRAWGALALRPPPASASDPAASLELPPLTFHSAYPPLLRFFQPALWLESRLTARLRPSPAPGNHEGRPDDKLQQ